VELYNMKTDFLEKTNVAASNSEVVNRLKPMAINWFKASFREFANRTIRVATDGDEGKDGSSWENATTLASAITRSAQISGTQIWLKTGTYPVSNTLNFDNIAVYGGFAGTEQHPGQRNWKLYPSVIDGGNTISPLRNSNLTSLVSSVLDGVIVQNGLNQVGANGNENGGGMILANGAVLRNCIFRNNRTQNGKNGAALHCHQGSVTIENCLFVNNTSTGNGGAVQVGGGVTANIINCTFANNKSVKPGGAFGLGTSASNLNVINSIAYNNLYGETTYNSYGQNDDLNGGGTVISKNSAIESASTKFTDGNDMAHILLTREITPDFVAPASVIGNSTLADDIQQIETASYQLAGGSRCVNAGNVSYTDGLLLDLAAKSRVQGDEIDMGAYEYQVETDITGLLKGKKREVIFSGGKIQITGADINDGLMIYNINGMLMFQKKINRSSESFEWEKKGLYIIKIEDEIFKIIV